jgi:hypothetical protein
MHRTTLQCFEFCTGLGAAKVEAAPAARSDNAVSESLADLACIY